MATQAELGDKEIHRLALEVARLLNGLSVGSAMNVMSCATNLVQLTGKFDVDGPGFQGQIAEYNRLFDDDIAINSKL